MTAARRYLGCRPSLRVLGALTLAISFNTPAQAQFVRQAVGGISIDAEGMLDNAEKDANGLRQFWLDNIKPVPGDLQEASKLRKISLRGLAELLSALKDKTALPDEVRFLAGLQRIEYVLVYPDLNDIVLCGFGEGWKVDPRGHIVGVTTGRPVMQLDDLLVALRSAERAADGGITCSIDPTKEGLARMQQMGLAFWTSNGDPRKFGAALEKALGPQDITFHGVPADSRFAHILLAADYRMKRLAMNFDRSPVKGLPSYLQMIKNHSGTGKQNMMPRWWLTTNYDPLLTDEAGLAWRLRGQGVKAMTQDEILAANGERKQTGKASPAAQKWADLMTEHYDELCLREPIFGELRNCIDLAIASALIFRADLAGKAALDLGCLLDADAFPTEKFFTPKQVDTKVSYVQTSKAYILSASGGVEINSWAEASKTETSDAVEPVRSQVAEARGKVWWWN
jgi:hypothetical protein